MQDQPLATPASTKSSFASLLAALAEPAVAAHDEDLLTNDVATLSYEQALRSQVRSLRPDSGRMPEPPSPREFGKLRASDLSAAPRASGGLSAPRAGSRKSATITIRLSSIEYTQLHERATTAGLTASAYLRSCIFEAETLRAQVKEALLQLRSTAVNNPRADYQPTTATAWWTRLLPRWSERHPAGNN